MSLLVAFFRKRCLNKESTRSDLLSDSFKLMSGSLARRWTSVFASYNSKELTTSLPPSEDAMYEEYRDELDDFVTVKD